jgi:tRNA nucleotidyltransferase (CCA-adding enzyme)
MKAYLVGGAVRDALLELPFTERDWVVVGADKQMMTREGFRSLDGDFPVFAHPQTQEEYALARRETKRGPGYRGFEIDASVDVTLEEDLRRRDLTINAIAQGDDGELIDPFGGQEDLAAGLLRHVSPAFTEDPVRLLRIARFAAKLGAFGFRVAHGTHRLMREMVAAGAAGELQRERVNREAMKALATDQPWRFFEVLHRCGALADLLPLLDRSLGPGAAHADAADPQPIAALKRCTGLSRDPRHRLVALLWPCITCQADVEDFVERLRLDRTTAGLLRRVTGVADASNEVCADDGEAIIELAVRWAGLGDEQRTALAAACAAQCPESAQLHARLLHAIDAARNIDITRLRDQGLRGPVFGAAIERERRRAAAAAVQRDPA